MRSVLLVILLSLAAPSVAPTTAPTGQLIVVAAPRHPTVTNMQASYRTDDPRLVNRIVAFDGAAATFDGVATACSQATRTTTRIAAGLLIRQIFPNRPNYGKVHVTTLADFGLKIAPTDMVTASRFRCTRSSGSHGEDWTGATLFPLGDGRWALSLIKDHLLILRPAADSIRASFDCSKAGSRVERTICSDRLLAGWDRSVADAYQKGNGDLTDQRAWLAERDGCGADKECLHLSMSNRIDNLMR